MSLIAFTAGSSVTGGVTPPIAKMEIGAGLISRVNVLLLDDPFASVTVTVSVIGANPTDGVPVICPIEVLKLRPLGNAGVIAYVSGEVPPVADTGLVELIVTPLVKITVAESTVVDTAGLTASTKVLLDVVLLASVTVTVSTVAENAPEAVPEIVPVAVSKTNPADKAGVIAYDSGEFPPAPLTGLKLVARPTVRATVAESCVVLNGPLIRKTNVDALEDPFASVTVTVSVRSLSTAIGVPVI